MRKPSYAALLTAALLATPALCAETATADPDLAQFRSAYIAGEGLAYVVIADETGEHVYRFGDVSRLAAKKDVRGYMLFTCASPHPFVPQWAEDKARLLKAKVVNAGDARFAELDARYLAGCQNPFVKSAVPKNEP